MRLCLDAADIGGMAFQWKKGPVCADKRAIGEDRVRLGENDEPGIQLALAPL